MIFYDPTSRASGVDKSHGLPFARIYLYHNTAAFVQPNTSFADCHRASLLRACRPVLLFSFYGTHHRADCCLKKKAYDAA